MEQKKNYYRNQLKKAREIMAQQNISNDEALQVYRWSYVPIDTTDFEPAQILDPREFMNWSEAMIELNIKAFAVNPGYIINAENIDTRWSVKQKPLAHEDKAFEEKSFDTMSHQNDLGLSYRQMIQGGKK